MRAVFLGGLIICSAVSDYCANKRTMTLSPLLMSCNKAMECTAMLATKILFVI